MKPRKVHRFGFRRISNGRARGQRNGERSRSRAACGAWVGGVGMSVAVEDAAFANVPAAAQCETCLYREPRAMSVTARGYRISLLPDEDVVWEGGVSSMETMFLAFARLALDLVNLKSDPTWRHRCYFRLWQSGEQHCIEPCACGAVSLLDVVLWGVGARRWHRLFDSTHQVREEDSEILQDPDGNAAWGTWCRRCLRVVGEWHKPECRIWRVTRAEERLIAACGLSPDTNLAAFVGGIRSHPPVDQSDIDAIGGSL